MNRASVLLPAIGLVLAMLIWGSSFIAMKYAFQSYDPWVVVFGRMLVALLCFLPFLPRLWPGRDGFVDLPYLFLMVLMEPCLYFILEAFALENTTASQAGMITSMLPLMVAVAAGFWLHERICRYTWSGFFIAIAGAWWLSLSGESSAYAPAPLLGNVLEFFAMVCAALYTVILKRVSRHYTPMQLTFFQAIAGTLFYFPVLFLPSTVLPADLPLSPSFAVLYLGTLVSIGAYVLYSYGVSRIPATQASAFVNLIPVFSVVLGFLVLGERFTPEQFTASAVVFAGVLLSQWGGMRSRANEDGGKPVELETG